MGGRAGGGAGSGRSSGGGGARNKYTVEGFKAKGVKVLNKAPKGWKDLKGATTAPNGYKWMSNGKSLFGGEYQHALVKK